MAAIFNPARYARPGLSEDEILEIKEAFDIFDDDKSGSIDISELKAAMVNLGLDSKNAQVSQMVNDLDSDGSGSIDFDESLGLHSRSTGARNRTSCTAVGSGILNMRLEEN